MPTKTETTPEEPTTEVEASPESATLAAVDVELSEEEILRGTPALLPPEQFRQRQRSAITGMLLRMNGLVDDDGKFDEDDTEKTIAFLNLLGDADDFFESIAADKKGYVEWSKGLKNSEQIFGTLITRYARAVGE